MVYQGVLKKMMTENAEEIQYYLDMKSDFLNMNQLINKEVTLSFVTYECLNCHLEKKIYRQGFCQSWARPPCCRSIGKWHNSIK